MATFILVHGAMHGGWCWERLVPLLEAQGHVAHAIDLPGSAGHVPHAGVTLSQAVAALVALIDEIAEPVILVGHSLGGMAISGAAEARPDRVQQLIYLVALLPEDNESASGLMAYNQDQSVIAAFQMLPDEQAFVFARESNGPMFYNDCAPADVAAAVDRLVPQSLLMLREPLRLSPGRFGQVPKHYIATSNDQAVQYPFQQFMIARAPGLPVVTMAAGHSPFYSHADDLAAYLGEVSARL